MTEPLLPGALIYEREFLRVRKCRHGVFAYSVNDGGVGRSLDFYGEWCEHELTLLGPLVPEGGTVLDVGANVGTHAAFFAERVGPRGRVIAFEPQSLAFGFLETNLTLNGLNLVVDARRLALGSERGNVRFDRIDPAFEANFGMASTTTSPLGELVLVAPLDDLELERCDLMKLDVEGMEAEVLSGARATLARLRPPLFVENDRLARSAALIDLVFDLGYEAWWHVPPLYNAANYLGNPVNAFGSRVTINMLCLHRGASHQVEGLEPVRQGDTAVQALERVYGPQLPSAEALSLLLKQNFGAPRAKFP